MRGDGGVTTNNGGAATAGPEIVMSTSTAESIRGQLGQGIYSLAELRLFLAYHGTAEDGDRALEWLEHALNPIAHRPRQPDYSFADLISLLVVRELVSLGVKLFRIREAERYGRTTFGMDRPFVSKEVATDGTIVFYASEVPEQVETANKGGGQQVDRKVIGPYLKRVVYADDGNAVAWQPTGGVMLDPTIQFGDPVVRGTRVPTSAVADIAETAGVEVAAQRLSLKLRDARSAVRFEHDLAALRD